MTGNTCSPIAKALLWKRVITLTVKRSYQFTNTSIKRPSQVYSLFCYDQKYFGDLLFRNIYIQSGPRGDSIYLCSLVIFIVVTLTQECLCCQKLVIFYFYLAICDWDGFVYSRQDSIKLWKKKLVIYNHYHLLGVFAAFEYLYLLGWLLDVFRGALDTYKNKGDVR